MNGDLLRTLPDHILTTKVFTFFGFKDYALTGCACTYSQAHWQMANQQKPLPLYVPEDCKTLEEAVTRVEQDPRIATIVLGRGEHQIDAYRLNISSAMRIVGRPDVPKETIVVMGGIEFHHAIQGNCHLQHLTLRRAKGGGVLGQSSFTMEDVLVEQCGGFGVLAGGTGGVGRCTNVEVRQCGMRGVVAANGASITLIGAKTTVHHNCTKGSSDHYGLEVSHGSSSTIQLVSPLTKEQVSLDNGGGGNWGANWGDINQIKTIAAATSSSSSVPCAETKSNHTSSTRKDDLLRLPDHVLTTKVIPYFGFKDYALASCASQYLQAHWQAANQRKPLPLYIPEDCKTLKEAVKRVAQDQRITTIVLGKGVHRIDDWYLEMSCAMSIVGRPDVPKEKIVVLGGIFFKKGVQGICHLQHLTLRGAKEYGVWGWSSFTLEDVLVEQCSDHGVFACNIAEGTGVVGRCTNVEVRHCGGGGVYAGGVASITLIGAKTTVHHNCTQGDSDLYGLKVYGSFSTIQLTAPLTKEQVSLDNGGGGNWGANWGDINQIKTISATTTTSSSAPCGETKSNHTSPTKRDDLLRLPDHVFTAKVVPFFGFKDYALASCAAQYLQAHWQAANRIKPLPLYVPEDCKTLKEAVERVAQDPRITTIVLGKGEHQIFGYELKQINGLYLGISSAIRIVGRPDVPKEKIVVVGGIRFKRGIQGNCHLQHLTLRQAEGHGVIGHSSFTIKDVLVEQCGGGVSANGTGVVARCTNVEVRQCAMNGVYALSGGSITLIGAKTTVHHNCRMRFSGFYGLKVRGSSSIIQLVFPLTKEQVSTDNVGGDNWGAVERGNINQIKTMTESEVATAARERMEALVEQSSS